MLEMCILEQIDSFKISKKLKDESGRIKDQERALYMICEAKGILASYYQASRSFSRRVVRASHSVPYLRLMVYGWQPSVDHMDFAGILNANALFSFTVGFPVIFFAAAFLVGIDFTSAQFPCEVS